MIEKGGAKVLILAALIELLFALGQQNLIISISGFGLYLIVAFILKPYESLLVTTFLIPNQRLLTIGGGGISIINIILIMIFLKILFTRFKNPIQLKIVSIIMIFYCLLVSIINFELTTLLLALKIVLLFYILNYFVSKSINEATIIKPILFFVLGVVFTGIIGIFLEGGVVLGTSERYSGGDINNANILSSQFSFSIALLLILGLTSLVKKKYIYIIMLFLFFFGLLTQSRSFLLSIVFILLGYLLSLFKFRYLANGILISIFFFFFIIASDYYFPTLIEKLINAPIDRVLNPKGGDVSSGRSALWLSYLNAFLKDPTALMLGKGAYNTQEQYDLDQVAHNSIIETVAAVGLIGLMLFLNMFYVFYSFYKKNIVRINKVNFIIYLPLVIIFINGMTQHSFVNMGTIWQFCVWILLFVSVATLKKVKL